MIYPDRIDECVRQLPGIRTIFEVGCDDLTWIAPSLRSFYPDAVYHGFDCDPRHIENVRVHQTDIDINATFHPIALLDHAGQVEFYLADYVYPSSVRRPKFNESDTVWPDWNKTPISVPCDTMDHYLATHHIPPPDLLYMDVQSAEDLVLQGAQATLPHIHYIFSECNTCGAYINEPGPEGILAHLPGWEVVKRLAYDFFLVNPNYRPS